MIGVKPKRGFPAKYVKVKLFLLEEDRDYLDQIAAAHKPVNRSDAGRLVIGDARKRKLFLDGIDANVATEQQP